MTPEAWVSIAGIIATIALACAGGLLAWLTSMWLEIKAIALSLAEFRAAVEGKQAAQEAHLENNDKRLDRHSVRLDDLETAVWRDGPRSSRILKKPITSDDEGSDPDNLKESSPG